MDDRTRVVKVACSTSLTRISYNSQYTSEHMVNKMTAKDGSCAAILGGMYAGQRDRVFRLCNAY